MRLLAVLVLAACGSAPRASLSNRGEAPRPPPPPMLGERGLRGHEDGSTPTKASIKALLPGAIVDMNGGTIVVKLASLLADKTIPDPIAMVIDADGAVIAVSAPQVTMPHGLTVEMTLADALRLQPTLACQIFGPSKSCKLPSSPSFEFHIDQDRIDYITFRRL
jgi:hypothetical protein